MSYCVTFNPPTDMNSNVRRDCIRADIQMTVVYSSFAHCSRPDMHVQWITLPLVWNDFHTWAGLGAAVCANIHRLNKHYAPVILSNIESLSQRGCWTALCLFLVTHKKGDFCDLLRHKDRSWESGSDKHGRGSKETLSTHWGDRNRGWISRGLMKYTEMPTAVCTFHFEPFFCGSYKITAGIGCFCWMHPHKYFHHWKSFPAGNLFRRLSAIWTSVTLPALLNLDLINDQSLTSQKLLPRCTSWVPSRSKVDVSATFHTSAARAIISFQNTKACNYMFALSCKITFRNPRPIYRTETDEILSNVTHFYTISCYLFKILSNHNCGDLKQKNWKFIKGPL